MNTYQQNSITEPMRWLTVKEVADETFSSESSVRRWIRKKLLKAYKMGRDWKIKPGDLKKFVDDSSNFSD